MTRIQEINKGNGQFKYTLTIPLEMIAIMNLKKGDSFDFEAKSKDILILTKTN